MAPWDALRMSYCHVAELRDAPGYTMTTPYSTYLISDLYTSSSILHATSQQIHPPYLYDEHDSAPQQ
jgi:hypothetical protein